jgi:hypothetical protein
MGDRRTVTVANLIAQLEECPPDAIVLMEECGCAVPASGDIAVTDEDGRYQPNLNPANAAWILLRRGDLE